MKDTIAKTTVVLITLAMAVASMVPSAYAGQCSQESAVGKYGVSDSGTLIGIGPRVAVSMLSLNTAGKAHGQVTASLNGGVTQTTLSGTYTVNPDCSGTASFGEFDQAGNLVLTATATIVWDDDMREFRFIFTSVALANGTALPTAVTGVARKVSPSEQ